MSDLVTRKPTGIQRIDRIYRGKPTHHYLIDGVRADGVTTLIGKGLPKPALLGWGIRSVAEYAADNLDQLVDMREGMGRGAIIATLKQSPYNDRDEAARRGTEVHNIVEKLVHGAEVEVPDEIRGHVEACIRFLDDWQPKPVLVEAVVASRRWHYAGSLDLIADLPDGRRVLFDYKTSRSGVYGETALQLAAYAHAEVYLDADGNEQPAADLGITHAAAVHVTGAGYSVHPIDISEDTWATFCHVAHVARKADSLRDLVGEAITP